MEKEVDREIAPQRAEDDELAKILPMLPEKDKSFLHGMAVAFQLQADAKASA